MRIPTLFPLLATILLVSPALAGETIANTARSPEALARLAVSEDETVSRRAVDELRALGPAGLEALMSVYAGEIRRHREGATPEGWAPVGAALDRVARQRDAWASGLYWYTDFAQASAASKASGRPILSLRMLGNLDDDLSCANSRFFRTLVYSDEYAAQTMREGFVLHWQSVRPVPRVTIDFGDGRRLERTLTGNSIHYVLDAEGRVLDALPGFHGAGTFVTWLWEAHTVAEQAARIAEPDRWGALRRYHANRGDRLRARWAADLKRARREVKGASLPKSAILERGRRDSHPEAVIAGRAAMTKALVEMPMLNALAPDARALGQATDDETWTKLAAPHAADVRLGPNALALIRGAVEPAAFDRTVAKLRETVALDELRNEYLFHAEVHGWLAAGAPLAVAPLNERVYAELFLTPSADPWLGLKPDDVFTGLSGR